MVRFSKNLWIPLTLLSVSIFSGTFALPLINTSLASKLSGPQAAKSSRYALGLQLSPQSVETLQTVYDQHAYDLDKVRHAGAGVPRLYLTNLPFDLRQYNHLGTKKTFFIKMLLPLILKKNESILADRKELLRLRDKKSAGAPFNHDEKNWLYHTATAYRVKGIDITALLKRIDVVPPSLAIAQGIKETGWGTSHAALSKNSPFGHMRTKTQVRSFPTLCAAVNAYMHNINSNLAYKKLHDLRSKKRAEKQHVTGSHLAGGLVKYSERGMRYVKDIQALIKKHNLEHFDKVSLQ